RRRHTRLQGLEFRRVLFRSLFGGPARAQADSDVEAGVAQVQRMRAALAAVTDDGDLGLGGSGHGVVSFEGGFVVAGKIRRRSSRDRKSVMWGEQRDEAIRLA